MRITGTSPMVKECNVNLVKWFLLDHGAATKPEIAQLTGISLMTVGKIVNEMCEQGALIRLGTQESALGRKAEQFAVNPAFGSSVGMRFLVDRIDVVGADLLGEVKFQHTFPMPEGYGFDRLVEIRDFCRQRLPKIQAVAVGFPAPVFEGRLHSGHLLQFKDVDVQHGLDEVWEQPVLIGRDLNITSIGFARGSLTPVSGDLPKVQDLAYMLLSEAGYGAGFLAGGRVVRGFSYFAGEIGRLPLANGEYLRQFIDSGVSDDEYVRVISQMVAAVTCVVNPAMVVFTGDSVRPALLERIGERLRERVSFNWEGQRNVCPELIYEEDIWPSYRAGLVYLATRQIHSGVCMVEESF